MDSGNLPGNIRRLAGMHLVRDARLADYIGLSRTAMNAIVNGKSQPRVGTLMKIAEAFGVTLGDLFAPPISCLAAGVKNYIYAPIQAEGVGR
jgi:transcriptional regulator with XRE-family HTH domain